MVCSNYERVARRLIVLMLLLCVFSMATPTLFAEQEPGKKVNPSSSGKTDIREIEKREKESPPQEQKKKVENETQTLQRDLPVPKGAKGKTFKVKPSERKKGARFRHRRRTHVKP